MRSALDAIGAPFTRRLRVPRVWSYIAFEASRAGLLVALALVPAVGALALVAAGGSLGAGVTSPERVRSIFSGILPGLITAATLSVGFAALAMRRGIKGIGELREHASEDSEYRDELERDLGRRMPVGVPDFLATVLDELARASQEARSRAGPAVAVETDGVRLGDLLETIEGAARRAAHGVRAHRANPDRALAAAIDLESEVSLHLLRAFAARDDVPAEARRLLDRMVSLMRAEATGVSYLRTLATQWGLSRMVQTIVATSFVAIVVAAFLSLVYSEELLLAWGTLAAGVVVALGLFIVTMPIAAFASFTLRFVFLNEHTLPLGEFVLGPENEAVARGGVERRSRGGSRGGA